MKLDLNALQFERELKQAKRLSLLEYAANERHKHCSSVVCSRQSSLGQASARQSKASRNTHSAVKRLQYRAGRFVSRRSKVSDAVKTSRLSSSVTLRNPLSYTDSCRFVEGSEAARSSRVDVNAQLELISASNFDGTDSGFDDLPVTDFVDQLVEQKVPQPSFRNVENYVSPTNAMEYASSYYRFIGKSPEELDEEVEYDADEEDLVWLRLLNEHRRQVKPHSRSNISVEVFEAVIDRLEKEAHAVGQHVVFGTKAPATLSDDDDAVCAICGDDECTNTNAILFCDVCNLAVHQECYGVPFVPEGQWLCRRCQAGVDADVACCLCPVRGGALKQTNDGRWAHVVCALWIPEVGFGNIELLEPITKLSHVPPARHRLTCTVCGKSRVGACVQCMHKHCYKAFHITCAQQIGLYMKIEPLLDSAGVMINVTKTLLCENHKPSGVHPFQPMIDNSIDNDGRPPAPARVIPRPLPRGARKHKCHRKGGILVAGDAEPSASATCEIPVIPPARLTCIAESLCIHDKYQLMSILQAYWLLKRRSRNGIPLLRRLQITVPASAATLAVNKERFNNQNVSADLLIVKKLRQEMEKLRLLLELIRKRERMKNEMITIHEMSLRLKLEPFAIHLHRTLDQLQAADTAGIFALPVSAQEAPDYFNIIKYPMDFSTMRSKIDSLVYKSFKDFEADFWHIVNNCQAYNADGSMYYKLSVKLGQQGKIVLDTASKADKDTMYNTSTGLHATDYDKGMFQPCCFHRTRSSCSADDDFESLPLYRVSARAKKHRVNSKSYSTAVDDDDGPPELSRCPSPFNDTECSVTASVSVSQQSVVSQSLDPPALTPLASECSNSTTVEGSQLHGKTHADLETVKLSQMFYVMAGNASKSSRLHLDENASVTVAAIEDHCNGSTIHDAVDSLSLSKPVVLAIREEDCHSLMPLMSTDCSSSYGFTFDGDSAVPALSYKGTYEDDRKNELDCHQSPMNDKHFALKSCDVS